MQLQMQPVGRPRMFAKHALLPVAYDGYMWADLFAWVQGSIASCVSYGRSVQPLVFLDEFQRFKIVLYR